MNGTHVQLKTKAVLTSLREKETQMWYKLLVENKYAEHLITEDDPENNTAEQEKIALQVLDKYADIVYGVTMA